MVWFVRHFGWFFVRVLSIYEPPLDMMTAGRFFCAIYAENFFVVKGHSCYREIILFRGISNFERFYFNKSGIMFGGFAATGGFQGVRYLINMR